MRLVAASVGRWQLRVRESRGPWHAHVKMFGEAKVWREGGEADRLRLGHLPCVDDFVGIICPAAMTSGHDCGALSEWIGAQCAESRRPPRVAVRPSSDGQTADWPCGLAMSAITVNLYVSVLPRKRTLFSHVLVYILQRSRRAIEPADRVIA